MYMYVYSASTRGEFPRGRRQTRARARAPMCTHMCGCVRVPVCVCTRAQESLAAKMLAGLEMDSGGADSGALLLSAGTAAPGAAAPGAPNGTGANASAAVTIVERRAVSPNLNITVQARPPRALAAG